MAEVTRFFNVMPTRLGLYDQQGRVRPTYFVFKMLSQLRGKQWNVSSSDPRLHCMAVESNSSFDALFWSFASDGILEPMDVAVRLSDRIGKRYRLIRLKPMNCVEHQPGD